MSVFDVIIALFSGVWKLATSIRILGVTPVELSFACLTIWLVLKKYVRPVLHAESGDSDD